METHGACGKPSRVTVEVEIGGRLHRLELERDGEHWVVTVGGRSLHVDATRVGGSGWSLLFPAARLIPPASPRQQPRAPAERRPDRADRTSYDVTLESGEAGAWLARVNGEPVAARVIDPRMRRAHRRDSVAASGSRLVTSAMPGRVVKVLVKPGDRVIERQPLVVVEAMKMENELRAPGDALVRDVNVTEGMSIDAGSILVVLE